MEEGGEGRGEEGRREEGGRGEKKEGGRDVLRLVFNPARLGRKNRIYFE